MLAGDRVSTGDKARTELEFDYANMLRLAEHTQANITQLTRSQIQIQLGHGMANYTVYKTAMRTLKLIHLTWRSARSAANPVSEFW